MPSIQDFDLPLQSVNRALDEIDRILCRMTLLAELSASDLNVDREVLQKIFSYLQDRIDCIADGLPGSIQA